MVVQPAVHVDEAERRDERLVIEFSQPKEVVGPAGFDLLCDALDEGVTAGEKLDQVPAVKTPAVFFGDPGQNAVGQGTPVHRADKRVRIASGQRFFDRLREFDRLFVRDQIRLLPFLCLVASGKAQERKLEATKAEEKAEEKEEAEKGE